jgi:2-phosphosulfolactate phosphatase
MGTYHRVMNGVENPQPGRQPQSGRRTVKIYPLPTQIQPGDLRGGVAVVLDVLRASTTIVTALANGAACVIPCADVETARQLAARQTPGTTLLGGERGGVKIEGFDLDNSPASYSRDRVAGKTIVFTTTNGTAALLHTREAARVLIGSLVNRQAIVQVLCADQRAVHLVCAGTDGRATSEDLLGASAIVAELSQLADVHLDLSESTAKHWQLLGGGDSVIEMLRRSAGGQSLVALGLEQDIVRAAEVDSVEVVPEYCPVTGRIEPLGNLGLGDRAGFR